MTRFHWFSTHHPAFLIGISCLLATFFAMGYYYSAIPALCLFAIASSRQKLLICAIFLVQSLLIFARYNFPEKTMEGAGFFTIDSFKPAKHGGMIYGGRLESFYGSEGTKPVAKALPCRVFAKQDYAVSHTYFVEGVLSKGQGLSFFIKAKGPLIEMQTHRSLLNLRSIAKLTVESYVRAVIPEPRAANFLSGLATGQIFDKTMSKEFRELGLAHVLVISGFHFVLIALFFEVLLRPFFSPKWVAGLLLFSLSIYFLFIGNSPSISRAYICMGIYFVGHLINRPSIGLNSLGAALLVLCLIDPLSSLSLSFQLSFLATGGILVFNKPLSELMNRIFPKRSFKDVIGRSLLYQHGYLLRSFFKGTLCLALAVECSLSPVILYVFHMLPWHSLLYNLLFPTLVSVSLLLLLFTIPVHLILPPLGSLLHQLNSLYTSGILTIVESPPLPQKSWYVEHYSPLVLTVILSVLLVVGIHLNSRKRGEDHPFPGLD